MLAYIKAVDEVYKKRPKGSDKYNTYKLDGLQKRIVNAGMRVSDYMLTAVMINKPVAEYNKWPYPYFNVTVSQTTFDRVAKLLKSHAITDDQEVNSFEKEMNFARMYIEFLMGVTTVQPIRSVTVTNDVKVEVATHLCHTYGISPVAISYPYIANALTMMGIQWT